MAGTSATRNGRVRVLIVDDEPGPGIPPGLLPSVFERFTRAGTSRARTHPHQCGSGLGLAMVAAIVSAHDGRLDVTGEPGHTELTIEIPRRAPPDSPPSTRSRPRRPRHSGGDRRWGDRRWGGQ
ncbi:sensor histidine kinase [Streptomyces brasiliscabiei]|uniref:histidine kinase n=1 Tax=Streptomyces brasiliscabiei TaxID=2736302 RepID=A0ABU8G4T9_9ACTN